MAKGGGGAKPRLAGPNDQLRTSSAGRRFIQEFEGFVPRARDDGFGNLTTGYGHVVRNPADPLATRTLSRAEADALLARDLRVHERAVAKAITRPLAQHEFDALVSFSFNAGTGSLRSTGLAEAVNTGDTAGVDRALFSRTLGSNRGLLARRIGEFDIYSRGVYPSRVEALNRVMIVDPVVVSP